MSSESKPTLVSVRDHRDRTIDALSEHFARDDLSMDEYEERVDRAHCATSIAALDQLVSDLEPIAKPSVALTLPAQTALDVSRPRRKRVVAIMGGVDRKGQWVVPSDLRVSAIMGGVDLDFREALLPPGVTEVKVYAIMGGVDIIVPPNVAVEAEGFAIMGGFEEMHRAPAAPDPDRPLLRISGFALMGGVDIETRLPGETWWQARKRARKERKELRARERGGERARLHDRARKRLPDRPHGRDDDHDDDE
jgi:hypothetical protein